MTEDLVPACGGSIRIETVRLDRAARAYDAQLRTQRLLRAMVGRSVSVAAMLPLIFAIVPLFYFTPLSEERRASWVIIVVGGIGLFGLSLAIAYLYFWALRAFAAGSLRAARVVLVALSLLAADNVVALVGGIFDFATADTQPNRTGDWSRRPMLAVVVAAQFTSLSVVYLMLTGPARILRCRKSRLFRLFLNHNYHCEFWPGWSMLLRNLWTLLGVPTLLHQKKVPKRAVIAALAALSLEGSVLLEIMQLPGRITEYIYKYSEQWSQQKIFLNIVVALSLAPFLLRFFWAVSRRLRRYARWRALLSMEEARLADPRRPVLFLRSFGDDQVSLAQAKVPWLLRFFDPLAIAGTLEELLLREFGYLGPVVAIGKPAPGPPPLGAVRKYCRGESWQEVVASLMDEASLIVVGAARSEGLAWEIAALRDKGLLSKTIFVLPPASTADHAVLGRLFGFLGADENIPDLVRGRAALALSFPAPDYGLLLVSARVSETEYELALRVPQLADLALSPRSA